MNKEDLYNLENILLSLGNAEIYTFSMKDKNGLDIEISLLKQKVREIITKVRNNG